MNINIHISKHTHIVHRATETGSNRGEWVPSPYVLLLGSWCLTEHVLMLIPLITKLLSTDLHWLTCSTVRSHSAGSPPQRNGWWSVLLLLESWLRTWVVCRQFSSTGGSWARSVGRAQSGWLQDGGYRLLLRYLQNKKKKCPTCLRSYLKINT